jgi:hypothetical protein
VTAKPVENAKPAPAPVQTKSGRLGCGGDLFSFMIYGNSFINLFRFYFLVIYFVLLVFFINFSLI